MSEAQIEFLEFQLTWAELRKLPQDHVAAFSVLSYAVSEVNVFRKNYVSVSHSYTGVKGIDSASNINKFLLLRNWSSKLFECGEFLRKLHRKKETEDKSLLAMACAASKDFEELNSGKGLLVARLVRNEAAHHYSFQAARESLKHVVGSGDFNFYTHDVGGNDFYPIGEEVMFHARLHRMWANVASKAARDQLFYEWLEWNCKGNRLAYGCACKVRGNSSV